MKAQLKRANDVEEVDALVVGAGFGGIEATYRLRELGLSVRAVERGGGAGGTWYWNRYPGARTDSESYTYAFYFSEAILHEWQWSEHYASQPEIERYFNYVIDKLDLRRHIEFNATVTSAVYDELVERWDIRMKDGGRVRAKYFVPAVGILSAKNFPDVPGIDDFAGLSFHSSEWPDEPLDYFAGKRVAVVGTGSTGVQIIQAMAPIAGHLTVFQRGPDYVCPLNNGPITPEFREAYLKENYPELIKKIRESTFGFTYDFNPKSFYEATPGEREALWEELWADRGLRKSMGNYVECYTSLEDSRPYTEFVRNKLRARIKDPALAEKLVPNDHPMCAKRVPLETNYYEVYHQDNVDLVSLHDTPIERVTPGGIKTSAAQFECDIIIYATGFDAITGSMTRMDIRGVDGVTMKDHWAHGPRAYLTMFAAGFPNMFIVNGSSFCNTPRCLEQQAEFLALTVAHMCEHGYDRVETTHRAEEEWMRHGEELGENSLLKYGNSWIIGGNIEGKKRVQYLYPGGNSGLRAKLKEVLANDYDGLGFKRSVNRSLPYGEPTLADARDEENAA